MRERLNESSQDIQQDRKPAARTIIKNLLATEEGDLRNLWQDRTFLFEFPRLAVYLISSEGQAEFSKDQRASLFALSLKTFLTNNNQTLSGYSFTKDGKFVGGKKDQGIDSATRALIGSILLIGMSLNDKEKQRSILIESYKNLSSEHRKVNFTDNVGRLLAQNNATRTWIKENRIDAKNGFDWDHDLAYQLFFGIYTQGIERLPIPHEITQDLKDFSLQTLSVMLNFALEYAEKLSRSKYNAKLTGFIMQMEKMEITEDMRKKLGLFKQKVSFKMTIA